MTAAELRDWQQRTGIRTDSEAASIVGLSLSAYRRQRSGRARVSRQTELLALRHEIGYAPDLLRLAGVADALNRAIRLARRL